MGENLLPGSVSGAGPMTTPTPSVNDAEESLTIITCGGNFNRETREYTNRQVVTAVKI